MPLSSRIFQFSTALFVAGIILGAILPRTLGFTPAVVGLLVVFGTLISGQKTELVAYISRNRDAFYWVGGVILLSAASILWSVSTEESLDRTLKFLPFLPFAMMMPLLWRYPSERAIEVALQTTVWAWVIGLVLMNIELMFDLPIYRLIKGLDFEKHVNPSYINRQVVFLCLLLFILYPIYLRKSATSAQRFLKYAIPLLTALMLVSTESQSAVMAFLVGTLTLLFFPSWSKWGWLALKIFLVVMMFAAPLISMYGFQYLAENLSQYEFFQDSYAASRLEIWDMISRRMLESPLYGFGIESTRTMTFDVANLYHPVKVVLHPHNFAVQMWIEFGVIGAAFGSGFLWWLVSRIERLPDALQRSALPCFMGTLTIAATGYGLWQGWWLGTFLWFAATLCMVQRYSEDRGWLPITTRTPV